MSQKINELMAKAKEAKLDKPLSPDEWRLLRNVVLLQDAKRSVTGEKKPDRETDISSSAFGEQLAAITGLPEAREMSDAEVEAILKRIAPGISQAAKRLIDENRPVGGFFGVTLKAALEGDRDAINCIGVIIENFVPLVEVIDSLQGKVPTVEDRQELEYDLLSCVEEYVYGTARIEDSGSGTVIREMWGEITNEGADLMVAEINGEYILMCRIHEHKKEADRDVCIDRIAPFAKLLSKQEVMAVAKSINNIMEGDVPVAIPAEEQAEANFYVKRFISNRAKSEPFKQHASRVESSVHAVLKNSQGKNVDTPEIRKVNEFLKDEHAKTSKTHKIKKEEGEDNE